jgi:hypothetical protein
MIILIFYTIYLKKIYDKIAYKTLVHEICTGFNSTYKKLAFQCTADNFVVAENFVFRINIWGKNRQLLLAKR